MEPCAVACTCLSVSGELEPAAGPQQGWLNVLLDRNDYAGLGRIVLSCVGIAFIAGAGAGYSFAHFYGDAKLSPNNQAAASPGTSTVAVLAHQSHQGTPFIANLDLALETQIEPAKPQASTANPNSESTDTMSSDTMSSDKMGLAANGDDASVVVAAATPNGSAVALPASSSAATDMNPRLNHHPEMMAFAAAVGLTEPGQALANTTAQEFTVRRGDTLLSILGDAGLDRLAAHAVVDALNGTYDPRSLRAGQTLQVSTTTDGDTVQLDTLEIAIDNENDLAMVRQASGEFQIDQKTKTFKSSKQRSAGAIDLSLYISAQKANVPQDALLDLIRIYSYDIDFQRDIHPGDRFDLLFEKLTSEDGSITKSGDIIYAELTSGGEPLRAYHYVNREGEPGYYDESGQSLRKSLMRTPIDGARLSSGFGKRKHPILGYTKMHKGVDFAAPRGTPIYAAGDGKITSLGRNGGYGKYIRIRHNGSYSTAYAHLHKYAKGLKSGSRVKQGQVIGYVGSTGRSTGPHLHYEILKEGRQINPLSVKQDVAVKLKGAERERFMAEKAKIDRLLEAETGETVLAQNR